MNPDLQFIFKRRSVRKFTEKPIPDSFITDLLEAAMAAPSAVARDPWHYLVINNKETLGKIANVLPHGRMLKNAAAAFIVCGEIGKAHDQQESYMLQDLSASVENILLAATALGLGSCWLGVHPRPERMDDITKLFDLPANIIPMCGIALGWPAENHPPRTRYNEDCVHMGKW
ncbi:MAG: nitroreductase family protein [Proteobacteria bacterium]|nr:nitroreductase family protein [Pseudomonadota bacterium]MBU1710177.1 nitroreductase family protein [Pseudomonadota bacterium]